MLACYGALGVDSRNIEDNCELQNSALAADSLHGSERMGELRKLKSMAGEHRRQWILSSGSLRDA